MECLRFKSARQTETEAASIRYWAELVGIDTDTKQAIRRLIALRRWFSHATWPLPRRRGRCHELRSRRVRYRLQPQ
jgi:hypothetical protein